VTQGCTMRLTRTFLHPRACTVTAHEAFVIFRKTFEWNDVISAGYDAGFH
jgi:hypothetical protein